MKGIKRKEKDEILASARPSPEQPQEEGAPGQGGDDAQAHGSRQEARGQIAGQHEGAAADHGKGQQAPVVRAEGRNGLPDSV